jgi:glc operon protein GlcG
MMMPIGYDRTPAARTRRRKPRFGEDFMKMRILTAAVGAAWLLAGAASAQQPAAAPNPLDVIPDKMPWDTPYGPPINAEKAQAAIAAAAAEAKKRGWALDIAVVGSPGYLVAFLRMDNAQIASIAIAEHKARAAAKYRRPTKVFEEGVQRGLNYLLTLDDIIASRGGIPLIEDGRLIGAIGCSGGTGSQDEAACMVGAATINK